MLFFFESHTGCHSIHLIFSNGGLYHWARPWSELIKRCLIVGHYETYPTRTVFHDVLIE